MDRLLTWHTRLGEVGLRLLQLHLLWLGWTLIGGVAVGLFPATAAVYAVLRRDALDALDGTGDAREPLRREFARFWRQELRPANVLGYLVLAAWTLLLVDRRLVATVDMGAAAPAAAGLLWLLTAVAFVMTANLGVLVAHFAEGAPALLRRSAVLALGRPGAALLNALVVGAVLCAYYEIPGLVPVFGVVLPAWASLTYLWSTGVLPMPAAGRSRSPTYRTGARIASTTTPTTPVCSDPTEEPS